VNFSHRAEISEQAGRVGQFWRGAGSISSHCDFARHLSPFARDEPGDTLWNSGEHIYELYPKLKRFENQRPE
jgi:hypothetical protein